MLMIMLHFVNLCNTVQFDKALVLLKHIWFFMTQSTFYTVCGLNFLSKFCHVPLQKVSLGKLFCLFKQKLANICLFMAWRHSPHFVTRFAGPETIDKSYSLPVMTVQILERKSIFT